MNAGLPPRIGINAIFLAPGMGGLETYVQALTPELIRAAPQVRFRVYCSPEGQELLSQAEWAGGVDLVSHRLFGMRGMKALTELTLLGRLAGAETDLLHSVALTAPIRTDARNVVTIADTTWFTGPAIDATTRLWRLIVPPVARRADRVIAISEAGATDIQRHLRVPRSLIDTTLLGHQAHSIRTPALPGHMRTRLSIGEAPLILTVGTRKPHKNVLGLIRAMPRVLENTPGAHLVLAGNPTTYEGDLLAAVRELAIESSVSFLPYVDSAQLEGLYAAATCFVLPSFTEGFGLPVLEAMARGVPVACADTAALPEVAGSAARYFDPASPSAIADALTELLTSPGLRDQLIGRGFQRAAELTWAKTAEATLRSYARAWSDQTVPDAGG